MFTRAFASGPISEASTPVNARSSGPTTRKQRHGVSTTASGGTRSLGQMIDSSSGAHVTEMTTLSSRPPVSEAGSAEPAGSRHTAYSSGSRSRSSMREDYGRHRFRPMPRGCVYHHRSGRLSPWSGPADRSADGREERQRGHDVARFRQRGGDRVDGGGGGPDGVAAPLR